MQTVKVVGAELAVAFPISQDVKSDLQKFVCNGQDGALGSTPSRQAPVQRREIVVPLGGHGPCRLTQASSQPGISFPGFPALPLAGGLVTAGTYSHPTRQPLRLPKLVHFESPPHADSS